MCSDGFDLIPVHEAEFVIQYVVTSDYSTIETRKSRQLRGTIKVHVI